MKYTYVNGDDWKGLYLNNDLIAEGHSFRTPDLFNIIMTHGAPTAFEVKEADIEWLENLGNFPELLSDCKFYD